MRGDPEVDDLPSPVTDHKPGIQQSEPNGRDDQRVHRSDAVLVIAKKRPPLLALIVVRTSLREVSRDGGEADRDPKLFEFGPDFPGAPAVLIRESTNEGLHLRRNRGSSGSWLRARSPVEPETLAMPADNGVWLDDDQDLSPARPEFRQKDPEDPIDRSDSGLGSLLGEGGKLLTESEFDDRLLASASKESWKTAKEDRHEFEQVTQSEPYSVRVRCSIRDSISIGERTIHRALIN